MDRRWPQSRHRLALAGSKGFPPPPAAAAAPAQAPAAGASFPSPAAFRATARRPLFPREARAAPVAARRHAADHHARGALQGAPPPLSSAHCEGSGKPSHGRRAAGSGLRLPHSFLPFPATTHCPSPARPPMHLSACLLSPGAQKTDPVELKPPLVEYVRETYGAQVRVRCGQCCSVLGARAQCAAVWSGVHGPAATLRVCCVQHPKTQHNSNTHPTDTGRLGRGAGPGGGAAPAGRRGRADGPPADPGRQPGQVPPRPDVSAWAVPQRYCGSTTVAHVLVLLAGGTARPARTCCEGVSCRHRAELPRSVPTPCTPPAPQPHGVAVPHLPGGRPRAR